MRLVYEATGQEVKVGDTVSLMHSGAQVTVEYFHAPHKAASEGHVTVKYPDGFTREFYVSVIGATWVEREDRE